MEYLSFELRMVPCWKHSFCQSCWKDAFTEACPYCPPPEMIEDKTFQGLLEKAKKLYREHPFEIGTIKNNLLN